MIKEITITVKPEEEKNLKLHKSLALKEIKKNGGSIPSGEVVLVFVKKSIDARHGQLKLHLRYKVYIGETPDEATQKGQNQLPEWKTASGNKSVIIIGAGPAGLFGALTLLEKGIKPRERDGLGVWG